MKDKVSPTFFICGAARSGTTFLVNSIDQHQDIYIPYFTPEPHYFYYSWKWRRPWHWYIDTYFANVKNEKAVGEKSTSYMYHPLVAKRMHEHLHHVKLIFLLRNPIDRIISNYKWSKLHGLETVDFPTALTMERELYGPLAETKPFDYIERSKYYEQIERFLKVYPRHQMLILKAEDMFIDPFSTFRKVYDFLEVEYKEVTPAPVLNDTKEQIFIEGKVRKWLHLLLEKDLNKLKTIIDFDIEDWK